MRKRMIAAWMCLCFLGTMGCNNIKNLPQESEAPAKSSAPIETPAATVDYYADIIVIGAGGAGMSAAIEAVENGAQNIVVLEIAAFTGGNTARAKSGVNAAGTQLQAEENIEDTAAQFLADILLSGEQQNDTALARTLAEQSAAAVDFINEIGGDLTHVTQSEGASAARLHQPADTGAVGPMLVQAMNKKLNELKIPVLLNTQATKIICNEAGAVSGVVAIQAEKEILFGCKAVIIATGGFSANEDMVAENEPLLFVSTTTNTPGTMGDGLAMAQAIGAHMTNMEFVQMYPTVNAATGEMYTAGFRKNGAILVNALGARFTNELETDAALSKAILLENEQPCYLVFDETVRQNFKDADEYISTFFMAETVEALAGQMGVDAELLAATLESYRADVDAGEDTAFSRPAGSLKSRLDAPNYYAVRIAVAAHHTLGGIAINTDAQVLNSAREPIPGLFAAGEVTGGVHGASSVAGSNLTDAVVFGRIAGANAHDYVRANGGYKTPTIAVTAQDEAVPQAQGNYTDGVYSGTGVGKHGAITVEVTIEGGNIVAIKPVSHNETASIFDAAATIVIEAVIRTQATDVDTVTGATVSSGGTLDAVRDAVKKAQPAA
ncbi:flavocytochrome c [Christensenellaceae bacterium OttesenSCG-928-L17]|nr:flavocytochrome c [Christensenellaceae bacterium OttesenSCG-928-L17]